MLRKIMPSLLLGLIVAGPAIAQQAADPEDRAFDLAVQSYHGELAMRLDPPAHYETVRNVLGVFDGRVIVEEFLGGQFYMMMWHAGLGNIVITRDGEEFPSDTYVDEAGRPAFTSGVLSGWVDVLGAELHVQVSAGGESYRWRGVLPSETDEGTGSAALITARKEKCICKGTAVRRDCSDPDCTDGAACWTGAKNSKCAWLVMPVPQPKPKKDCLSTQADGVITLGVLGAITFCPPVRRRLMRRVRSRR